MNNKSVGNVAIATALKSLVYQLGHGTFFHEATVALKAAKDSLPPDATDTEIKGVVWKYLKAENKIFFTEVFIPVLEDVIAVIIPIALFYLNATNPVAGMVATAVVAGLEAESVPEGQLE